MNDLERIQAERAEARRVAAAEHRAALDAAEAERAAACSVAFNAALDAYMSARETAAYRAEAVRVEADARLAEAQRAANTRYYAAFGALAATRSP